MTVVPVVVVPCVVPDRCRDAIGRPFATATTTTTTTAAPAARPPSSAASAGAPSRHPVERQRRRSYLRPGTYDHCRNIDDLARVARVRLDDMTPRDLSSFWRLASRMIDAGGEGEGEGGGGPSSSSLRRGGGSGGGGGGGEEVAAATDRRLEAVLVRTLERMGGEFGPVPLAESAMGFAKIARIVRRGGGGRRGGCGPFLRDAFGPSSDGRNYVFAEVAAASMPALRDFEPRALSNLAYSFGLAECVVPLFSGEGGEGDGNGNGPGRGGVVANTTFFDVLAEAALPKLDGFNPQDLANALWAYGSVGASSPAFFRAAGDVAASRFDDASGGGFKPREISSMLWSYATLKEGHPALFRKVEGHILRQAAMHLDDGGDSFSAVVLSSSLSSSSFFGPQALSNTMWAYATSGEGSPKLYNAVADRIVSRGGDDLLDEYTPQSLSNLIWAYATAGVYHPGLFDTVARRVTSLVAAVRVDGDDFDPAPSSADAIAKNGAPMTTTTGRRRPGVVVGEFNHQNIANLLWSYASIGRADGETFRAWIPAASLAVLDDGCDVRSMTSIAWAYAVADVSAPSLFGEDFAASCLGRQDELDVEGMRQLYQWHLWQAEELGIGATGLPPSLGGACYRAFLSTPPKVSALQSDVVSELEAIGLRPDCEALTKRGYRLDAIVEVEGRTIGIEVDGPSHFAGRRLTGNAALKRRQVTGLEGIPLVSVPYWEWNALKSDRYKKQQYLSALLGLHR